jgi:phage terminase large subunit
MTEAPVARTVAERVAEVEGAGIEFPSKFRFLFKPMRYKIAHGGRGGAKSWGFARALLVLGAERSLRIGCFREVQSSIKESVHQLLKDQIEAMGLSSFYSVFDSEIRGRNGTLFRFAGLSDLTVDNIKSFEGLDIAWVEEAQAVSANSWKILIPTIRRDGSEIWISMNPELDTDPTYKMFIESPPEGLSVVVQINYRDNPFFPTVLEEERQRAKRNMPADEYNNVWLGHTRAAVEGAIYAAEVATAMANGQICNVPYDPGMRVHVILDLGWNDFMFAILAQRHLSELRVIEAIETNKKTLDWLSADLKLRRLNYGKLFLPHDGKHVSYQTGKSSRQIMREKGWTVEMVPNITINEGIKSAREAIPRTYIDKKRGDPLVQCLRRYRRDVNSKTKEEGTPVHDRWSHGSDAYRYLSLVAEKMTNFTDKPIRSPGRVAAYSVDDEMGM